MNPFLLLLIPVFGLCIAEEVFLKGFEFTLIFTPSFSDRSPSKLTDWEEETYWQKFKIEVHRVRIDRHEVTRKECSSVASD